MEHACFDAPRAPAGKLAALGDGDSAILVPAYTPVGTRDFIKEDRASGDCRHARQSEHPRIAGNRLNVTESQDIAPSIDRALPLRRIAGCVEHVKKPRHGWRVQHSENNPIALCVKHPCEYTPVLGIKIPGTEKKRPEDSSRPLD